MKTANYVSITRTHSSLRETLIIDPSLFIPLFLRPPLTSGETEETRNNLKLESTHGHVSADVTLAENISTEIHSSQRNNRVKMLMRSTHGGITAKIVCFPFVLCSRLFLNITIPHCSMDNPIGPLLYFMLDLSTATYVSTSHATFMDLSLFPISMALLGFPIPLADI